MFLSSLFLIHAIHSTLDLSENDAIEKTLLTLLADAKANLKSESKSTSQLTEKCRDLKESAADAEEDRVLSSEERHEKLTQLQSDRGRLEAQLSQKSGEKEKLNEEFKVSIVAEETSERESANHLDELRANIEGIDKAISAISGSRAPENSVGSEVSSIFGILGEMKKEFELELQGAMEKGAGNSEESVSDHRRILVLDSEIKRLSLELMRVTENIDELEGEREQASGGGVAFVKSLADGNACDALVKSANDKKGEALKVLTSLEQIWTIFQQQFASTNGGKDSLEGRREKSERTPLRTTITMPSTCRSHKINIENLMEEIDALESADLSLDALEFGETPVSASLFQKSLSLSKSILDPSIHFASRAISFTQKIDPSILDKLSQIIQDTRDQSQNLKITERECRRKFEKSKSKLTDLNNALLTKKSSFEETSLKLSKINDELSRVRESFDLATASESEIQSRSSPDLSEISKLDEKMQAISEIEKLMSAKESVVAEMSLSALFERLNGDLKRRKDEILSKAKQSRSSDAEDLNKVRSALASLREEVSQFELREVKLKKRNELFQDDIDRLESQISVINVSACLSKDDLDSAIDQYDKTISNLKYAKGVLS